MPIFRDLPDESADRHGNLLTGLTGLGCLETTKTPVIQAVFAFSDRGGRGPNTSTVSGWRDEKLEPNESGSPLVSPRPHLVNSAPIRRRSLVEEESIHVIVGRHGNYRAAWLGNWPGRGLGTKVRF